MKKKLKALTNAGTKTKIQRDATTGTVVAITSHKPKRKITENSFEIWYSENKSSLSQDYVDYVYEMKQSSGTPYFFKTWAKTVYNTIQNLKGNI